MWDLPRSGMEPVSPTCSWILYHWTTREALSNIFVSPWETFCAIPMVNEASLSKSLLLAQLCPTLCDPVDCSPPGSSVRGILQARILEWVAISFSRGSSPPRDQTQLSCTAGRFFIIWATREVLPSASSVAILGLSELGFYNFVLLKPTVPSSLHQTHAFSRFLTLFPLAKISELGDPQSSACPLQGTWTTTQAPEVRVKTALMETAVYLQL